MAKTDFKCIDEYHATVPEAQRERLQQIREIVHRLVPEAEEVISYQIPAFKYRKGFLVYYCAFAKHITLSSPWSESFLKAFEEELKGLKVSKSAIQFPNEKPSPVELIERMVRFRREESEI